MIIFLLLMSDLVVLPEFFSTGFYTDPTEKYETMKGETVAWMLDCAQKFQAVITGSLVMRWAMILKTDNL